MSAETDEALRRGVEPQILLELTVVQTKCDYEPSVAQVER